MTIYTDAETGKKYDRLPGGMQTGTAPAQDYVGCEHCALYQDSAACHRAVYLCTSKAPGKTVFFIFRERKT